MSDKKTFTYFDSKQVEHTIEIDANDFVLTQSDKKLFDQKIQTKPTTFFKDALRRFAKNKSSVAGAFILGFILLCAIILPVALPSDVKNTHAAETTLAPKLFEAGTGWWDGCCDYKHVAIDVDWETYDRTNGITIEGLPAGFEERAIIKGRQGITYESVSYINAVSPYAHNGYVRVNLAAGAASAELRSWDGHSYDLRNANEYTVTIKTIDPTPFGDWSFGNLAETYHASFSWLDATDSEVRHVYELGANIPAHGTETFTFDLAALQAVDPDVEFISASTQKPYLSIYVDSHGTSTNNLIIETVAITSAKASEQEELGHVSILDANESLLIKPKDEQGRANKYFWTTYGGNQNLYHAKFVYGAFRYDTYEVVFGNRPMSLSVDTLKTWSERGWLTADFSLIDDLSKVPYSQRQPKADAFLETVALTEEGEIHCPLVVDDEHPISITIKSAGGVVAAEINGTVTRWKVLYPDRKTCPKYLFGTDDSGRDIFKMTFKGLRTSLLLGLIVAAVTFTFGLIWGAIAGYFGGWTDMLMERFTDILGGIPWIVLMTLAIVRFGSSFGVFVMALCLTGWIGTASLTRTQFYRFKNREYILAARTLGAKDFRLIFRHILPNAVGTIVTSSVFMITSVIYSESTIAYLGLGLKGMDSFGVILADNQIHITDHPALILFPSFIMLLMMISFNLFGNGLRDAFNPSLKGSE